MIEIGRVQRDCAAILRQLLTIMEDFKWTVDRQMHQNRTDYNHNEHWDDGVVNPEFDYAEPVEDWDQELQPRVSSSPPRAAFLCRNCGHPLALD